MLINVELNRIVECPTLNTKGYVCEIYEDGTFLVKLDNKTFNSYIIKENSSYFLTNTNEPKSHKIILTDKIRSNQAPITPTILNVKESQKNNEVSYRQGSLF